MTMTRRARALPRLAVLLAAGATAHCGGSSTPPCLDADKDGYAAPPCGDDCADTDPSVNPGVAETEAWTEEVIDESAACRVARIVLDSSGDPHVFYCWRLASRGPTGWTVEDVASSLDLDSRPPFAGITFGPDDVLHVAYFLNELDAVGNFHVSLHHAWKTGGIWATEMIFEAADVATPGQMSGGLESSPDGTLHIVFLLTGVLHGTLSGGEWIVEPLGVLEEPSPPIGGERLSLAVGTDGSVHVTRCGGWIVSIGIDWRHPLMYATTASGAWEVEEVWPGHFTADCRLELDANDQPRIFFVDNDGADEVLHEALATSDGWSIEDGPPRLGANMSSFTAPSFSIDSTGREHGIFEYTDNSYFYRGSTGWIMEPFFEGEPIHSELVVGRTGIYVASAEQASHASALGTVSLAFRSLPDGIDDDCDAAAW